MGLVASTPFPSSSHLPPSFVRFQPLAEGAAFYGCDIEGDMHLFDISMNHDNDSMQHHPLYSVPVGRLSPTVTALTCSPSGDIIAVCGSNHDDDCSLILYHQHRSSQSHYPTMPRVHAIMNMQPPPQPLDYPPMNPLPPLTLSPLELSPASKYLFRPTHAVVTVMKERVDDDTPLSSWLPPSPSILHMDLKHQMTLIVAPRPTKVLAPPFEKTIQQKTEAIVRI
jgi:hypothetical protein